jgi:glycosyltransferase involved in cell wall biosynthesis
MRFHLAGLPHTNFSEDYLTCAFTQLGRQFAQMMEMRGHEVEIYWGRGNDPSAWHPHNPTDQQWLAFNAEIREQIEADFHPGDVLCLASGWDQRSLIDLAAVVVEYAVGYEGLALGGTHRVFPSYAYMHYLYGKHRADGRFTDVVIPHPIDPDQFYTADPEEYYLYVGRVVNRKGVQHAIDCTERIGAQLIVAGPDWGDVDLTPSHVEWVGPVGLDERARLMAHARALFAPTTYVEAFGLVVIEALASGCPVITTDWGAFTETVNEGVTGHRCRTPQQFDEAARNWNQFDRSNLRRWTVLRYGLESISWEYDAYFQRLVGGQT